MSTRPCDGSCVKSAIVTAGASSNAAVQRLVGTSICQLKQQPSTHGDGQLPRLVFVVNDACFFLSHRKPIALAAQRAGYEVHVVVPKGPGVDELAALGCKLHFMPLSRSGTQILAEFRSLLFLIKLYRRLRPDLVHHVTIKPIVYGGLAARITRVPAVVSAVTGLGYLFSETGSFPSLIKGLAVQLYRHALHHPNSAVIFQNADDRQVLAAHGILSKGKDVLIRGSGVDLQVFNAPLRPCNKRLTVLMASRLLWQKGVGRFVAAARILRSEGLNARFLLAGAPDGGNPDSIAVSVLQDWHKEGVVEWLGFRRDIPDLFAMAHVVVFPSTYREGVPKVLLEAAASGRPIVASDIPGCREVVQHGVNGFLVNPNDVHTLACRIRELLTDDALRLRMGAKGREKAFAEFSSDVVVDRHLALYDQLLMGTGRRTIESSGGSHTC